MGRYEYAHPGDAKFRQILARSAEIVAETCDHAGMTDDEHDIFVRFAEQHGFTSTDVLRAIQKNPEMPHAELFGEERYERMLFTEFIQAIRSDEPVPVAQSVSEPGLL